MGEYFTKKDYEEDVGEEVETEEEVPSLEPQLKSMKEVIKERNHLFTLKSIRLPEFKERIGRLNLNLFGDPQNLEWVSKLQELKQEIRHPMTRSHPIAHKMHAVAEDIELLQIEYGSLQKFIEKLLVDVGNLLDSSIKIYSREYVNVQKIKQEYQQLADRLAKIESKKDITAKELINDKLRLHMKSTGLKNLQDVNIAMNELRYQSAVDAKRKFINDIAVLLQGLHVQPEEYATKVFDANVNMPWEEFKERIMEERERKKLEAQASEEKPAEEAAEEETDNVEEKEEEQSGEKD